MSSPILPGLPPVPERRLAIRITPDALRQVRSGHRWIYDKAIVSNSDEAAPSGSLAVIFDADRKFAAIGLWDPTSPIRVRILHVGKPLQIDAAFWRDVVVTAFDKRVSLGAHSTTGWRLIHGENDAMSGIVVDRYASTLVCKVYSECWLPHLNQVLDALAQVAEPSRIVLRLGRLAAASTAVQNAGLVDGEVVFGDPVDGPVPFLENGLRFTADVLDGQKTGHFLDQRDNRQHIRSHVESLSKPSISVLDVFSCTGGFSVYAAAGGATFVHSVDIAAPAIATAKSNMALNDDVVSSATHKVTIGDAFEVMAELGAGGQTFDVVVVDPPSFASNASERNGAIRAYRKLADLATVLVAPGGHLLQASCSSRVTEDDLVATVRAAVRTHGRTASREQIFGHAIDHPVEFAQGQYLKAIALDLPGRDS